MRSREIGLGPPGGGGDGLVPTWADGVVLAIGEMRYAALLTVAMVSHICERLRFQVVTGFSECDARAHKY